MFNNLTNLTTSEYLTIYAANGSEVPNTVYFPGATPPDGGINETFAWTVMTPDASNTTGPIDALINGTSSVLDYSGDICVVDNQTLYISSHAMPNMTFPFGRLAAAFINDTAFFYHQINESMLLEEIGDSSLGFRGFGEAKQIVIPIQ